MRGLRDILMRLAVADIQARRFGVDSGGGVVDDVSMDIFWTLESQPRSP